jgi:hypothetical protein
LSRGQISVWNRRVSYKKLGERETKKQFLGKPMLPGKTQAGEEDMKESEKARI